MSKYYEQGDAHSLHKQNTLFMFIGIRNNAAIISYGRDRRAMLTSYHPGRYGYSATTIAYIAY
jgi:hypothetical protein